MMLVAYGIVIGILLILLIFALFFKKRSPIPKRSRQQRGPNSTGPVVRAVTGGRQIGGNRIRRSAAVADNLEPEQQQNEEFIKAGVKVPEGKIGKKKMEKMQIKANKKLAREAEEREREEQKRKREKEEEEDRRMKQTELEEEREKKKDEKRIQEEKRRREEEEYLKLRESFDVEEEGFDGNNDSEDSDENKIQKFIVYIRQTKVVLLEDLASHFKMKTNETIDRINQLQKDNLLTGVIDDRGKFIYISSEELDAVAKFIRQKGRVPISELAKSSNKLICFNPPKTVAVK